MINNQTTNFTILSRIWNHDFYITQKSNFCTAGHKYLNKRVLRKNIFFQTGFYSQLKQFSSTFEAILMWFPSGFVGCTTDLNRKYLRETSFFCKRSYLKGKERTKEFLPRFTLVPVVQLRCLLRWLFVFYSLTAMIFLQ